MNPYKSAVFSFAMRAPEKAVVQSDVRALDHLRLWLTYKQFWCEHNPSITVNYSDDEFLHVGAWVHEHFDDVQGISFLPRSEHTYAQAPYEQITETQFTQFPKPRVDFDVLPNYEHEDGTISSFTAACSGGACEMVDLTKN
jgi:ribonucleoside-diphosphate reductase alpha chain